MPPRRLTSPTAERETALTRSTPSSSTLRLTVELAPMPPTSMTAASSAGIGQAASSSAALAPPLEPFEPFTDVVPLPDTVPASVETVWSRLPDSVSPSPGTPGNGRSGSPGRPGIGPSSSPPSPPPSSEGAESGWPSRQSVEYPASATVFSAEALVREMLPGKSSLDSDSGPAGWLEFTWTG